MVDQALGEGIIITVAHPGHLRTADKFNKRYRGIVRINLHETRLLRRTWRTAEIAELLAEQISELEGRQ